MTLGSGLADTIKSIEARDLTAVRGGRILFRGLSFEVAAGRALAVEGANGTGKTSLLRMIAGFLSPVAGTIRFGDAEDGEERGKRVGWLGHHDAVKPQMTVEENLRFYAGLYRGDGVAAAMEATGPCPPRGPAGTIPLRRAEEARGAGAAGAVGTAALADG